MHIIFIKLRICSLILLIYSLVLIKRSSSAGPNPPRAHMHMHTLHTQMLHHCIT